MNTYAAILTGGIYVNALFWFAYHEQFLHALVVALLGLSLLITGIWVKAMVTK